MDKIVIAQESVAKFVNDIRPGAYTSMTDVREPALRATCIRRNVLCSQIDFNTLDTVDLKPIGIYGSISAIVDFLLKAKCVDNEMYCEPLLPKIRTYVSFSARLLLTPRRPEGDAQQPILRSGLYLLNASHDQPGLVYIIFWPEDTTWDDSASSMVSRNRATFIRHVSSSPLN